MAMSSRGFMLAASLGTVMLLGQAAALAAPAAAAPSPDTPQPGPGTVQTQRPQLAPALTATGMATSAAFRPLKDARLDPLAGTGVDPLANQLVLRPNQGLPQLGTGALTRPVSSGQPLTGLPVLGRLVGLLPG